MFRLSFLIGSRDHITKLGPSYCSSTAEIDEKVSSPDHTINLDFMGLYPFYQTLSRFALLAFIHYMRIKEKVVHLKLFLVVICSLECQSTKFIENERNGHLHALAR